MIQYYVVVSHKISESAASSSSAAKLNFTRAKVKSDLVNPSLALLMVPSLDALDKVGLLSLVFLLFATRAIPLVTHNRTRKCHRRACQQHLSPGERGIMIASYLLATRQAGYEVHLS